MPRTTAAVSRVIARHAIKVIESELFEITREWAAAHGINMAEHECGCEFCARSTVLCPATQSSIVEELRARVSK